jgi:hypothetical protein
MSLRDSALTDELLRQMPKAELHIHIEGSLEPEMMFVNRSKYKTPSCELQDLRRGKRYPASRTGRVLVKKMRCRRGRPDPL